MQFSEQPARKCTGEENAHSSIGLPLQLRCYSKNDGRGLEQTKFAQDVTLTTPACTHRMPTIIMGCGRA
jgi:hypothetical protein